MDITCKQAVILAAVGKKPGISQPELFRKLEAFDPGLLKINFDQVVFRMLDKALLKRKKKTGGGPALNLLFVTEAGRQALREIEQVASFIISG